MNVRRSRFVASAFAVCLVFFLASFAPRSTAFAVEVVVHAGDCDRDQTPISVTCTLPEEFDGADVVYLVREGKPPIAAQVTPRPLLTTHPDESARQLHFLADDIPAGQRATYQVVAVVGTDVLTGRYSWKDEPGDHLDLIYHDLGDGKGKTVMRYMYRALDESTPEAREQTYKVYHHLFDREGRLVTKGPGGRYTHHRGMFFGFNKISYGNGKQADIWHCRGKVYQSHEDVVSASAGPIIGRHLLAIDWHGQDAEVIAHEQREMTVYRVDGGQMVEFNSRLETVVGPMQLRGDPQHAGFQFRASNHVASDTPSLTYYLRPDGKGEMGETRNWPDRSDHVNLPFNAMSFVIDDQRYTAVYLDYPWNPKEARYSERDYGRFGSYFEYDLDEDHPLELRYRIYLTDGELTLDDVERLRCDFAEAPMIEVLGG